MSIDEAVQALRSDPEYSQLVRDSYLGPDVLESANRFELSGEFAEVLRLLGRSVDGGEILDLGAGTGIAARAFARSGARQVHALEPEPSEEVGRGAIAKLSDGYPITMIDGVGEAIPLRDRSLDVVYTRQALHHVRELPLCLRECARVLRSGGVLLATREHVVDGPKQLAVFLRNHPVHRLAGGENAYQLKQYTDAVQDAQLKLISLFGPCDSVINAYPVVTTREELHEYPSRLLRLKLGSLGALLSHVPGCLSLVRARIDRVPGRLYSFLALKP